MSNSEKKFTSIDSAKIAVIGLGYVGLPLAVEFGKLRDVRGFDINEERIKQLNSGHDITFEVDSVDLRKAKKLLFTDKLDDIAECNIFIITVPTPIDGNKLPDLNPLIRASELVGKVLKVNDIVIYESTVFPGATEEECVPILEKISGLIFNKDFFAGYSPERINPGDKKHRLTNIVKVTSGSTPQVADFVDSLYSSIITAGTHKASSIRIAEAAKVIENTQRDLNIALINELSVIFNKMSIDTESVLEAAGTKWNFLNFRPGLVGGHCIGVDPYYLTYKAQKIGHSPEIILAGRKQNDLMASYVAQKFIELLSSKNIPIKNASVLVMGLAFKENCPDLRNTKVVDVISNLEGYGVNVDVWDTCVDPDEAKKQYNIELINNPKPQSYDGILLAVAHDEFVNIGADGIRKLGSPKHVIYDLKYVLKVDESDLRL
tara:strand:+ start:2087 stop:3385 length:1299 start_codon:yes stop_codon:yes gene_type:complete